MAITIQVVCYKSKTLSNGEHPIMVRICKDGKKKYASVGISVKAEYYLTFFCYICSDSKQCLDEHFEQKGVIEIIFIREILAKFLSREDNGQWHHIFGMYSSRWLLHILWCGLLSLLATKAMREASRVW